MRCPFSCSFRKPHPVPALFALGAVALCLGLGVWQMERLKEKQTLLSQIETARTLPALSALPDNPEELAAMAYRPVALTGTFAGPDRTLRFLGRSSNGYLLYTPLHIEDSDQVVLVNRGFVSSQADTAPPSGVQTVTGYLRPLKHARLFSPGNRPDRNIWFVEDHAAMEQALDMQVPPVVVESETLPAVRNDHLGYAITWFLLAGVAIVMFAFYHRAPKQAT